MNSVVEFEGAEVILFHFMTLTIQEVPAFRDFGFQSVIMKCEDHELRGLFLV